TEMTVGDLAAHLGHRFADGREEDLRHWIGLRLRGEHRSHDLVGVEITLETELGVVLPRGPDRVQRGDEFAHPARRVTPRHAETFLDMGLDLGAQPKNESALEYACRSQPILATIIGLRAKATAMLVPSSS